MANNVETSDSALQNQETELVARLRQGDAAALEQLYRQYVDRVYSVVFHQVGQDKSVAEDIVQETFMSALKSIDKFRSKSKFYTWLCSIAYHKVADFYRRQGREARHSEHPSGTGSMKLEQIIDSEPSASSKIESEEDRQVIERALSHLPLDYQQVLMFKYVEQMPVAEISLIMRRSPKSMEGLLTRARKALRDCLTESSEG